MNTPIPENARKQKAWKKRWFAEFRQLWHVAPPEKPGDCSGNKLVPRYRHPRLVPIKVYSLPARKVRTTLCTSHTGALQPTDLNPEILHEAT